jgi:putative DNA methylase
MHAEKRKLIEVSMPLEVINRESAREKSIRHGHPSTLHLWWARRPLAAARAVLFAQLVDDPSSHPDLFPTEEAQATERARLHGIIEQLVVWENLNNKALLKAAHAEIVKSAGPNGPPAILDPFAGGGSIPLEAQRLGLEAHASDLNPVAVLINKALIEIPPKFTNGLPVYPGIAEGQATPWTGAEGLAADVRAYGEWIRDAAQRKIGHLYPTAELGAGQMANVIAWIWARTVICPNPACGIDTPLVRSWWLGKKKGKEAYVVPTVENGRVNYSIGNDSSRAPSEEDDGTVGRAGATCISCGTGVGLKYIRQQGRDVGLGSHLIAIVADGSRSRTYLAPTDDHLKAALACGTPADIPDGELPTNPRDFKTPNYGLRTFSDLFTNRQLTSLTTLSDLVAEARKKALADALATGIPRGHRLEAGGTGAEAYADAVATYLGLAVSRTADLGNSIVTWSSGRDQARNLFSRQAIPMAWDFVEVNPFSRSAGDIGVAIDSIVRAIVRLPDGIAGNVSQKSATERSYKGLLVSTDPPYYDNIGYSDLSDFFYVWQRRALREVFPELMGTLLVPKADELVANPYRHGSRKNAESFFEEGFVQVFRGMREGANLDYPITVYYAFKQSETSEAGEASTGWSTILEGMIRAGWSVTATWPVRSERSGRMIGVGKNALASSIVLACRPRSESAASIDRGGFLSVLRSELPSKLRELQQAAVAPVDLAQSTIGPGMAVFTRYSKVTEADGTAMRVRTALELINQVLAEVLTELEGDFDSDTRWAIKWFQQHGFDEGSFGAAETLATALNTSIQGLERGGILTSRGGKVQLFAPAQLPDSYDPRRDQRLSVWEASLHAARVLDSKGISDAGRLVANLRQAPGPRIDLDTVKELAYLLYSIAERKNWSAIGQTFNNLASGWPDILRASESGTSTTVQTGFDLESLNDDF